MRKCSRCKELKEDFYCNDPNKANGGYYYYCKPCYRKWRKRYNKNNKPQREKDGLFYCSACSTYKSKSEFYNSKNDKFKITTQCKKCIKAKNPPKNHKAFIGPETRECLTCHAIKPYSEFRKVTNNKYKAHCKQCKSTRKTIKIPKSYYKYKVRAKKKGFTFNLTKKEFTDLINSPCHYCAYYSENKTVGIDRINNQLGYEKSNCVSCCKTCNFMKQCMTVDEMLRHIEKVLKCMRNKV